MGTLEAIFRGAPWPDTSAQIMAAVRFSVTASSGSLAWPTGVEWLLLGSAALKVGSLAAAAVESVGRTATDWDWPEIGMNMLIEAVKSPVLLFASMLKMTTSIRSHGPELKISTALFAVAAAVFAGPAIKLQVARAVAKAIWVK